MYKKNIQGSYIVSIFFFIFIILIGIFGIQNFIPNIVRDGNGNTKDDESTYWRRDWIRANKACIASKKGTGTRKLR